MSTPGERLKAWAGPRKWAIVGGLAPLLVGLLAFGLATDDWALVAGGFGGLILGWSGVMAFVMYPVLWEPQNRWRFLGLWIAVVTALLIVAVAIVFLLT